MYNLRDYQQEAVQAVLDDWGRLERPIIFMATGSGKTVVMADIVRRVLAEQPMARFLVISHTREIVTQTVKAFERHVGIEISVEMGDSVASPDSKVVVATRQSLFGSRLDRIAKVGFTHLLIDEAHHVAPDNQYWKIYNSLREANPTLKVAGFTATPQRADRLGLAIFTKIGFRWSIISGIEEGFLVPPARYQVEAEGVTLANLRVKQGDYDLVGLNKTLKAADWPSVALAAWERFAEGRKTVAFFSSIELSKAFVKIAKERGIAAAHVDGEMPFSTREFILARFMRGEIKIVSNVAVLTEGFDEPTIEAILWARPTMSEVLLTQAVGRGLRPAQGKQNCLILDLTPADTRLLTTGTLLGLTSRCPSCGVTFLKGFEKCPRCGAQIYTGSVQRSKPAADVPDSGEKSKALSGFKKDVEGIEVRARPKAVFEGDTEIPEIHSFYKFERIDTYFDTNIKGHAVACKGEWVFILDPIELWDSALLERAKASLDETDPLAKKAAERIVSLSGGHSIAVFRYTEETADLIFIDKYPFLEQALDAYRKPSLLAGRQARQTRWWNDPATPKQHAYLRSLQKQYDVTLKTQLRYKGEVSEALNLVKAFGYLRNTLMILARRIPQ